MWALVRKCEGTSPIEDRLQCPWLWLCLWFRQKSRRGAEDEIVVQKLWASCIGAGRWKWPMPILMMVEGESRMILNISIPVAEVQTDRQYAKHYTRQGFMQRKLLPCNRVALSNKNYIVSTFTINKTQSNKATGTFNLQNMMDVCLQMQLHIMCQSVEDEVESFHCFPLLADGRKGDDLPLENFWSGWRYRLSKIKMASLLSLRFKPVAWYAKQWN